jgi:hypothetical protein
VLSVWEELGQVDDDTKEAGRSIGIVIEVPGLLYEMLAMKLACT